jgi:3-oxoacyl-[acyl-carrier protein] reductase
MRLKDKVAIVTGSSRGIGKALLIGLAKEGAKVVAVARSEEELKDVAREIKAAGQQCLTVRTDVATKADVEEMVKRTISTLGRVDILVNNAGGLFGTPRSVDELKEEGWNRVVDIKLKGAFFCSQAVIPHMKRQGGGVIVNIASEAGRNTITPTRIVFDGGVANVAYSAANAGLIGLTKHLAFELGPFGIRVNAIAPGRIITVPLGEKQWAEFPETQRREYINLVPLRRPGYSQDIVGAMMFLVTEESAYVTGITVDVNGGVYSV